MNLSLLGWGNAGWGDEFLRGMIMTLAVATCAFLLSLVFGTIFASAKLSRFRILKIIGDLYTTILRGIPELLVGVPFPAIALEIMRRVCASHRFEQLVYSGVTLDAESAQRSAGAVAVC